MFVGPLDRAAAGRLFAERVGARAVEGDLGGRIFAATDGVPAWVILMAEQLRDGGDLSIAEGVLHRVGELPLPPRMRTMISSRVSALSPNQRSLIQKVAAFRGGVDLPTLAAVEGVPRDVAERPLQSLLVGGHLRGEEVTAVRTEARWGGGGGDVMTPAMLYIAGGEAARRCVHDAMNRSQRSRIHSRITQVLFEAGAADDDRVEGLAWHALLAGDERAAQYLEGAAELAERRGEIALAAGRFARAADFVASQRQADETASVAAVEYATRLALRASALARASGATDLAEQVLGAVALDRLQNAELIVKVCLARAEVLARREQWSRVVQELQRSPAVMRDRSAPKLHGDAMIMLGGAQLELGDLGGAMEALYDAAGSYSTADAGAGVARAWCGLAVALARSGELDRAQNMGMRALVGAVRFGGARLRFAATAAAAEVAEAAGDSPQATERWADATEVARGDRAYRAAGTQPRPLGHGGH